MKLFIAMTVERKTL